MIHLQVESGMWSLDSVSWSGSRSGLVRNLRWNSTRRLNDFVTTEVRAMGDDSGDFEAGWHMTYLQ